MYPKSTGKEVVMVSSESDGLGFPGIVPLDCQRLDVETGVLRNIDHRRKLPVDGMSLGLEVQCIGNQPGDFRETVREIGAVLLGVVFAAQIVTGKDQRSAGVLFLDQAEKVGGEADLGFDLLLAVAEVVVRNEGHDDTGSISCGQLEGVPVVVELPGIGPAHAVPTLALGGLVPMRKPHFLLGEPIEVRSQDDASGVPTPMFGIEGSVILREQRIAGVAEDALDEVEVGHQRSRHEEANLHALAGHHAGNLRADDRADQQRDHASRRFGSGSGERQMEELFRRLQRARQKVREHRLGNAFLVVRDGQPALGDMEDARSGPPVRLWIVQDSVAQSVAAQPRRGDFVFVGRQGEDTGQAVLVQDEGVPRQFPRDGRIGQVIVDEVVDPAVHRTGVTGKQTVLLTALGDETLQQRVQSLSFTGQRNTCQAQLGQFQVDVPVEISGVGGIQSNGTGHDLGGADCGWTARTTLNPE